VNSAPRAITLDLDDTLWPIWPVIERAEQSLQAWLAEHCPRTCERFPIMAMRALRERVAHERRDLAHDYTAQRKLSLRIALAESGDDASLAEPAFEVFIRERNQVELYPDVPEALARLARRVPVAALTNGNADLGLIGLGHHFRFNLAARDHGEAKPEPGIFLAACERLSLPPEAVLHVGDHPEFDVFGAHRAGMQACWVNRDGAAWTATDHHPHVEVATLTELADWLDRFDTAPEPPEHARA
jgi:FMN hydrolase / 5-amino-6-(5-phospho-D-ribitylamino)uracil phosphatase